MRCVVEDMASVKEGEHFAAQVALNSYSWASASEEDLDNGNAFFVPYSVKAILPASGPSTGGTVLIVEGSGFKENIDNQPRCRFGTPANYAIVEAEILSYNRISCIVPPSPELSGKA